MQRALPQALTFFDIPCKVQGRAWSPNTWKVRYYLNYRAIPYQTEWVHFSDIESACKARGIPPSKLGKQTQPASYTLPAIYDPDADQYVSESARILRYLDSKYQRNGHPPGRDEMRTTAVRGGPAFPKGTSALQTAFLSAFTAKVIVPLWPVIVPAVARGFPEGSESREVFERTRADAFGRSVWDFERDAEAIRRDSWERVRKGLGDVDRWLGKNEEGGLKEPDAENIFVMGSEPVFADFVVGATLAYMKNVWGEDSEQWKDVGDWHAGRWGAFAHAFAEYEQVQ